MSPRVAISQGDSLQQFDQAAAIGSEPVLRWGSSGPGALGVNVRHSRQLPWKAVARDDTWQASAISQPSNRVEIVAKKRPH